MTTTYGWSRRILGPDRNTGEARYRDPFAHIIPADTTRSLCGMADAYDTPEPHRPDDAEACGFCAEAYVELVFPAKPWTFTPTELDLRGMVTIHGFLGPDPADVRYGWRCRHCGKGPTLYAYRNLGTWAQIVSLWPFESYTDAKNAAAAHITTCEKWPWP